MEPELKMDDMASILAYCAYLRNVYHLQHRTLNEFAWFVDTLIFGIHALHMCDGGEYERRLNESLKKRYAEVREKYLPIFEEEQRKVGHDDTLLAFARTFLRYCREEYKEVEDG